MARRRRLKELGLEDADRFVPVSMFKGVLSTDENGDAIYKLMGNVPLKDFTDIINKALEDR